MNSSPPPGLAKLEVREPSRSGRTTSFKEQRNRRSASSIGNIAESKPQSHLPPITTASSSRPSFILVSPKTSRTPKLEPVSSGGLQNGLQPVIPPYIPAAEPKPRIREVEPQPHYEVTDYKPRSRRHVQGGSNSKTGTNQRHDDSTLTEPLARKQQQEEGERLLAQREQRRLATSRSQWLSCKRSGSGKAPSPPRNEWVVRFGRSAKYRRRHEEEDSTIRREHRRKEKAQQSGPVKEEQGRNMRRDRSGDWPHEETRDTRSTRAERVTWEAQTRTLYEAKLHQRERDKIQSERRKPKKGSCESALQQARERALQLQQEVRDHV